MGIVANHLEKTIGEPPTRILTDISLRIEDGEFVALTGRSGSGKSTLLYLLSTLDEASGGELAVDGRDIRTMNESDLNRFRNEKLGFVFQFHYLIAELSAIENVLLPARKAGRTEASANYAASLLDRFGLGNKSHRLPRQLSGGEQQRVAIARALAMKPAYLFADEPTGSLDSANSEIVMKIIEETNRELGTTVILVTHDPGFAARARRQIHLIDGRVAKN